jgi:hypothetical protein
MMSLPISSYPIFRRHDDVAGALEMARGDDTYRDGQYGKGEHLHNSGLAYG